MHKKTYILVLSALIAVLLALIASGCCQRTPEQRAESMVKHLVSTLKLDATQTAKLETMKDEYLAKRPDVVKVREESIKDITEMMMSPQIDQARLNGRMEKVQGEMNEMLGFLSVKFVELHDMLTPEQRAKLAAEMEKHVKKHHRS